MKLYFTEIFYYVDDFLKELDVKTNSIIPNLGKNPVFAVCCFNI